MFVRAVLVGSLGLTLAACGDKIDPRSGDCNVTDTVTYNGQVEAIFDAHCTTCHSTLAAERNGAPPTVNFNTYEDAVARARRAKERIAQETMPPGDANPVSSDDLCVIEAWIDQGTPEG